MDAFIQTHGLYERGDLEHAPQIEIHSPEDLKQLLVRADGNSYGNGFFKFIKPDKFRHYFEMWNLNPNECVPFIKCAFGHLIFFYKTSYRVLNPVFNCCDPLGKENELDFVMNILLCDRQSLENSFFIDVYEKVFPTLSAPTDDEMYAFVPALGLGGSRDAANVQKVRMPEQMAILSQL